MASSDSESAKMGQEVTPRVLSSSGQSLREAVS